MGDTNGSGTRRPVIVVGAGPVGMSAALALRSCDLPVMVLEAEPEGRPRPGSRAIYVHRESLQRLDQMCRGLGSDIARHGLVWGTKRTFWGETEVYAKSYDGPQPHGIRPFASLAQVETERLMLDACRAAGVEFSWGTPVRHVDTNVDGVRITDESGADWTADYVVAADGARSAVRRALDVPMEGSRSPNSFVIVDVAEDGEDPRPPERVFYYEHPAVGGRNVLLVPFAGGWRADLQCRVDDDPEQFNDPAGVTTWIGRVLPEKYAERVTWVSTYQFLQVVARELVDEHRRVLLVGEAGHLFAPFGARGMNSGIADAAGAAGAIRSSIDAPNRQAAGRVVEEFARRRHAAAEYNRDAAGAALAHMQARDPMTRAKRRAAAFAAVAGRRAGAWLDAAPYGPRGGGRGKGEGTY